MAGSTQTFDALVGVFKLDIREWEKGVNRIISESKQLESGFNKLSLLSAGAFTGLVLGVNALATAAGDAGEVADAFASHYQDATGSLQALREASRGTISDLELMKSANKAALFGMVDNVGQLASVMVSAKARGEELGISTTEAFNAMVEGIGKGNERLLKQLGMNLPDALQKTMEGMSDTEKQAMMLNYVIEDAANVQSKLGYSALSAADKGEILQASLANMKNQIGAALIPAFMKVVDAITPFIKGVTQMIKQNPQAINTFVKLASTGILIVSSITIAGKAFTIFGSILDMIKAKAFATQLSIGLVGIALAALGWALGKSVSDHMKAATASNNMAKAFDTSKVAGVDATDAIANSAGKAAGKINDITKAIEEENAAFEEQLSEIVRTAKERLAANKAEYDKEKAEFDKSQKERQKTYEQKTKDIQKQNQQRLDDLKTQLEYSKEAGSSTYEEDLANYEAAVAKEKDAGQKRLDDAKSQYEEETSAAQKEFEDRTNELQKKITEDEAMLQKHAEVIKGINTDVQKDEIDKLIEAHQKRISDLEQQRSEMDNVYDGMGSDFGGMIDGMNAEQLDWDGIIDMPTFNEIIGGMWDNIKNGFMFIVYSIAGGIAAITTLALTGIDNLIKSVFGSVIGQLISSKIGLAGFIEQAQTATDDFATATASYGKELGIQGFASGGVVPQTGWIMAGEKGPEMMYVPRGTQVLNNADTKRALSGTQNIEININGANASPQEIANEVMERLARQNQNAMMGLNPIYG